MYFFHAHSDVQHSLKFPARVVSIPKFWSTDVISLLDFSLLDQTGSICRIRCECWSRVFIHSCLHGTSIGRLTTGDHSFLQKRAPEILRHGHDCGITLTKLSTICRQNSQAVARMSNRSFVTGSIHAWSRSHSKHIFIVAVDS